jgi:hypothetical protein
MNRYFFYVALFFFSIVGVASAVTDDFTVRLRVGDDTVPPTTPTSLFAVPIDQTQVDLSWGASTDDFIFGGYQVFRDSTQIATTTLTTYSDSGLSASTTYTYFVRAFDSFFNYSSSSNIYATTTFPIPPIPPPTPTSTPATTVSSSQSSSSNVKIRLLSFEIVPTLHSAEMNWETNAYARFELRWGRSSSYELGFVTNNLFKQENTTTISDLQPGTVYQFQLIVHERNGQTTILKEGEFKTLDAPDTQAPPNVANLKATVKGDGVLLSWVNPSDSDFSYVRVVRSYLFYPTDPYAGYSIYQNDGTSFLDADAFLQHDIQYYTVYSYDKNGNKSSGAIVSIQKDSRTVGVITATTSDESLLKLSFLDIEFVQHDSQVSGDRIDVDAPFLIRIAYEKLPEHLKAITVSLTHPQDNDLSFAFLLKINNDKTYYDATIAPLKIVGTYPLLLSVFDYQTQQLIGVTGSITTVKVSSDQQVFGVPLTTTESSVLSKMIVFSWILLLLLLLFAFYRILRDTILEHKITDTLTNRQIVASLALLLTFGGISAYILNNIVRFGGGHISSDVTASAVNALGTTPDYTTILLGTLLAFVIVIIGLFFIRSRKK